MGATLVLVLPARPEPELKLWLTKLWLAKLIPEPESKLVCALSVPKPLVPCMAGKRFSPRMSRTGRGTVSAKSCTRMRIPNSISRERFKEASVCSAEMRAAR